MRIRSRPPALATVLGAAIVLTGCAGSSTAPNSASNIDAVKPKGGQSGQGTLLGSVVVATGSGRDTAFAPLPGATVTVYLYVYTSSPPPSGDSAGTPPTETVTPQLVTTETADQNGHFTVNGLTAGTYEIDAAAPTGSGPSGVAIAQSSGTNTVTVRVEVLTAPTSAPPPPPPPPNDSTTAQRVGGRR